MTIFSAEQARAQFPALHQTTARGGTPVFFDNPAGTQVPQPVIDAVTHYYTHSNANSGGAFATSQRSDTLTHQVRGQVAAFLNAPRVDEIVFGPNMTTLCFGLSRAIAKTLRPGDEIVLTRMDHDANVSPWLLVARDYDLIVRWVDIDPADCTLDMDTLEAALTDRTKVVATVHASNAVGTINPVARIAQMAKAAGALYVVDAVQSAPHIPVDVQAIGCDFLLCSAYKFFGPHIGVLWGHYDLLAELPAYKVRPSKDVPPYRWETGTPSYETIAGVGAAITYLATFNGGEIAPAMMDVFVSYERQLVMLLIDTLNHVPGVQVYGITDPARYAERVPTVVFALDGHTPTEVAAHLAEHDIYVWDGNYYAVEIMERLGRGEHGLVRVGLAHYNTPAEVERLAGALKRL